MDPERIIGQLLGSLVGRKRRRRSGLLGMAMGRGTRGGLLAGGTLLTAAGLVWGALESMQKSTVPTGAGGAAPPGTPPPASPPGAMGNAGAVVPPPLPGAPAAGVTAVPPPLPGTAAPAVSAEAGARPAATSWLPLLQVAISAARADGELSAEEEQVIREQATALGVAGEVDRVLGERASLDTLAAAFSTDEQRRAAYAIAVAVVRGDDVLAPGERMFLTQWSRLLRLPHDDIETIEREALGEE